MAAVGAVGSANAPGVYAAFNLPQWAPPPGLFGPVWSLLYTMMAVSAWLIWRQHGIAAAQGWWLLFLAQLVTNALWSWFFFTWLSGLFAFVNILTLLLLLGATIFVGWRYNKVASMLLVPYLFWVTFAAGLNLTVWQLNPQMLG